MKELSMSSGSVETSGRLAYVSQNPTLFPGTVQANILFGLPLDAAWYGDVIGACALDKDMSIFPQGDKTLVGDKGLTLSGGQKARINLARYHLV
jgi:ATP-binding cassette subfamily C (CFTR/MRP) protein 4